MPNTLEFPDGVRLAELSEIPGPDATRVEMCAKIQSASISPGYTLRDSSDSSFTQYAEINVDASQIWDVFRDLCETLLAHTASLLFSSKDDDLPYRIGTGETSALLFLLEKHRYQLSHDGFVQFSLRCDGSSLITQVLVVPQKHFKVWLNDERRFREVMDRNSLRQESRLEFIDEYPRVTVALRRPDVLSVDELLRLFEQETKPYSTNADMEA